MNKIKKFKLIIKNLNKSKYGFTLLEVVVTVGIVAVGLSVIFNTAINNLAASEVSKNTFIAAFLAQEGYELVRNFRDTNWLINDDTQTWRQQTLPGTVSLADGNYRVDYNDNSLTSSLNSCSVSLSDEPFLKIDSNGFYSYDDGQDTIFKRIICITTAGTDQMKVTVKVEWRQQGKVKSLTTDNLLYNWK